MTRFATAAGSRLDIGNDPRYNNSLCFDPFPFPDPSDEDRATSADNAERLHAHREAALERDEAVTMTGMYNVVEKLRPGEELTDSERAVHESGACGVLRDLHRELDAAVAAAYGWPWPLAEGEILERLVALHDERAAEETPGTIRWLRPGHQVPRFQPEDVAERTEALPEAEVEKKAERPVVDWPDGALVERHLETLRIPWRRSGSPGTGGTTRRSRRRKRRREDRPHQLRGLVLPWYVFGNCDF